MSRPLFVSDEGVNEIEEVYREYIDEISIKFSKKEFERFLEFLEIDFYDWVRSNLRYFEFEN